MLTLKKRNAVSPFRPFFDVGRDTQEMLNHFYGESAVESSFAPAIDIVAQKGGLLVKADLPGVDDNNVEISINDGVLTVSGKREEEILEDSESCVRSERFFGSFVRQFSLPRNVNVDEVKAIFSKGVLKIELPYTEEAKEKKIAIEVH